MAHRNSFEILPYDGSYMFPYPGSISEPSPAASAALTKAQRIVPAPSRPTTTPPPTPLSNTPTFSAQKRKADAGADGQPATKQARKDSSNSSTTEEQAPRQVIRIPPNISGKNTEAASSSIAKSPKPTDRRTSGSLASSRIGGKHAKAENIWHLLVCSRMACSADGGSLPYTYSQTGGETDLEAPPAVLRASLPGDIHFHKGSKKCWVWSMGGNSGKCSWVLVKQLGINHPVFGQKFRLLKDEENHLPCWIPQEEF